MHINKFKIVLNEFLNETGMSKNQLAAKSGVPQSQVSDWSNGKGVRFTRNSKKVLEFIEIYRKSPNQKIPEDIETAIRKLLNGDKNRVKALENMLNSLKDAFL